jgi:hypothetical protein
MNDAGSPGSPQDASDSADIESRLAEQDSSIEDVPGAPTWPIQEAESDATSEAPPVGLNWAAVSAHLGVDQRVLAHDGMIVVAGEYFPEKGFFIDPASMEALHVHQGDMAMSHGYFLGEVTLNQFGVSLPVEARPADSRLVVVPHETGPVIGLFADRSDADRARNKIMRTSLGTDLGIEDGPLGSQLRVGNPQLPGRVATVMTSFGGAIVSIAGKPTTG